MRDTQWLPGACLLLADPVVASLNDLDKTARVAFLLDMSNLGDALLKVTGAHRINYSILGNGEPYLHAHLFPRYPHEPEPMRNQPVSVYPNEVWQKRPFDPIRDTTLMQTLRTVLMGT